MIHELRARGRQCVFSVKQRDGIVISFGQTLVASLWKGLWTREHDGRHAEWTSALEVQGVRALVPPVLGQDDQSSRSVLSSAVVLWGYRSESKLTCVFEITIK